MRIRNGKSTNVRVTKASHNFENSDYIEKLTSSRHYHRIPPTYYPLDNKVDIELVPGTYRPRDLLNYSVKAFWRRRDEDLSVRHLNARKGFRARFVASQERFNRQLSKSSDNHSNICEFQIWRAQRDVNELKRYIDEFFFFGQLWNRVEFYAGIDIVKPTSDGTIKPGWNGFTSLRMGRCWLRVNIGTGDQLYPLIDIVETLVHEMAHAYLMVFSAEDCDACERIVPNTVGLPGDGHGPIFLMLHQIMITTIRQWEVELMDLAADDCPGVTQVSQSARQFAAEAWQGLTRIEKSAYGSRRERGLGGINDLIRLTDSGDVIVNPSLRDKALEAENAYRLKIAHQREIDNKLIRKMGS